MTFQSLYAKTSTPTTAPAAAQALLPDWPATFEGDACPQALPEPFVLKVSGLVTTPLELTLPDLSTLGDGVYEGRLVSVDGWSYQSRWDGVLLKRLIEKIQPLPAARYLNQTDASGRSEWLDLSAVRNSNALLCTGERGEALNPLYGGPLRLMLFGSYSYKGFGQLVGLEFSETPCPSAALARGYSEDGRIIPGDYYAFDQKSMRRVG